MLTIERDAAARHDHMDMRMMRQRRPPRMKHGRDSDPGAEMPGIGGDGHHRLGRRPEQQIIDQRFVLQGDVGDLGRQGEDDMEIPDRQQIGLALGQPGPCGITLAFGAMPVAATVIGDPLMAAVRAGLDVTAKGGGTAMFDRRHDLQLKQAQMSGMVGPIGGSGSTENVGDLERGAARTSQGPGTFLASRNTITCPAD